MSIHLCSISDRNECINSTCDINANCTNTIGSFDCRCNEGYRGDGFYCDSKQDKCCVKVRRSRYVLLADVNECLNDNGGCEDFCVDTDGSFTCMCPSISGTEPMGTHCVGTRFIPSALIQVMTN